MSSLRRILSIECADNCSLPLQAPNRRELARHHSLPPLSFLSRPQGLPSSPLPSSRFCKARHVRCSHQPFYSTHRRDSSPHQLASFQSVPAWSLDEELDSGARTVTWPISRKESLGTEDSVVYKELCDSVQCLEAPPRYAGVLNSEGVVGSTSTHVSVALCEEEKRKTEPLCADVKGQPLSLRMLKRKISEKGDVGFSADMKHGMPRERSTSSKRGEQTEDVLYDVGGSVNCAFSSLMFMMESLQQHTMWLRKVLMSEADARLHVMMSKVQQEMQDTFLWLFQKVFSCTPKLMLLTMILLSDFAVHSMGEQVALGVMPMGEPPTYSLQRAISAPASSLDHFSLSRYRSVSTDTKSDKAISNFAQESSAGPRLCAGGDGDKVLKALKVGGSMDGEAIPTASTDQAAMTTEDEARSGLNDATYRGFSSLLSGQDVGVDHHKLSAMWRQAMSKEVNLRPLTQTGHMLVAPVQAPELEADNYPCFDRTDLNYQHELSMDPSNPLLLANYAQFLHVVRHDHNRAEVLYERAVKADPADGEVIGKYASFLWVAKEDMEAAEAAYKAALAVDPANAYHAGSYAHFLWNSNSGPEDSASVTTPYQQVSTS